MIPIGEFVDGYGDKVAALGGMDMDKLGRMEEADLRGYVRGILDECMPRRFALGSGYALDFPGIIPCRLPSAITHVGIQERKANRWRRRKCARTSRSTSARNGASAGIQRAMVPADLGSNFRSIGLKCLLWAV